MSLFDLPQAKHFCASRSSGAGMSQSLPDFHSALPRSMLKLVEGTTEFEVHRANLINSVERWIVFALAHYRRAFDMLVPVSAPWAQVTLYYSSFFAANALLGMFGGWMGNVKAVVCAIDVERGVIGSQELKIVRGYKSPTRARGSHRVFWDYFYAESRANIAPWAPLALLLALDPVNSDTGWQIKERNDANYDMYHAWASTMSFAGTFQSARLDSLSGPAAQQMEKTAQLIKLALHFANECGLSGGALHGCGATGTRAQLQKRLVTKPAPKLVTQSELPALLVT